MAIQQKTNTDPESRESSAVAAAGVILSGDGDGTAVMERAAEVIAASPEARPSGATAAGPRVPRFSLEALRSLRTFESLKSSVFRWYFLSSFGNFGAMNMQMVVKGFLVYELTGSYAALGALGLANAMPGLGLSLVGGVIADRAPKKVVQQVGISLNALNALTVAMVLVAGLMRWEYLLIS